MSANASEEEKMTFDMFKKALSQMHSGEQSGVILPQVYDDSGKPLFTFEVKSVLGTSTYDVSKIISRYRQEIVTGLLAPMMIIGQDGSGSFALATVLESITKTVVEARLTEIRDVLNHDLVPQLFKINGFDTTVTPYFDYDFGEQETLEEVGKYIQRTASVGLIPKTPEVVNYITTRLGIDEQFSPEIPQEDMERLLTGYESRSSDGMASGFGEGTASSPSGKDTSISNVEN